MEASAIEVDPLEGCSSNYDLNVELIIKEEVVDVKEDVEDEGFNAMALLELATCIQTDQEPIEFNSTDAMVNPKNGLMVCLLCLTELESNLLTDHLVNAHCYRKVLFKCHICDTKFAERKLLTAHKINCTPPVKKQKKKSFSQIMNEVEKSNNEDTEEYELVACPMCDLEIPKYMLKDHLLELHKDPEMSLTCEVCQRNFKSKLTLKEHIKLVHNAKENSAECEFCGQKFRSRKYLANHKRNVHPSGNKIFNCEICGKIFKSRLCLHQHTKYVHPPESASAECPQCPKVFKSKMNLHQHLRVSHGTRTRNR